MFATKHTGNRKPMDESQTIQKPTQSPPRPAEDKVLPLPAIQQAISSIKFGVVQITIQDGRVVQIDKTEKIRLV